MGFVAGSNDQKSKIVVQLLFWLERRIKQLTLGSCIFVCFEKLILREPQIICIILVLKVLKLKLLK